MFKIFLWIQGSVLVPYASAQQLARRNHYKVEDADHLTICKPSSKNAINYSLLKDVLLTIMKGVQTQPTLRWNIVGENSRSSQKIMQFGHHSWLGSMSASKMWMQGDQDWNKHNLHAKPCKHQCYSIIECYSILTSISICILPCLMSEASQVQM